MRTKLTLPDYPAACRFRIDDGGPRLGWFDGKVIRDLTASGLPWAASMAALLGTGDPIGALVTNTAKTVPAFEIDAVSLLAPVDLQEIWAAGVTYERSRDAREQESEHAADMYARVYSAERPELFFKANPRRTVGDGGLIRVRPDARWTVPEPELALVLNSSLRIVGLTIGNDVSSRDIEGENPLYLPQAKVYDGSCALGPWVVPFESVSNPNDLQITCSIVRDDIELWHDETSTAKLHRAFDELVEYLGRSNTYPDGAVLLTGTCLVPPDILSLQLGDQVRIGISGLGVLVNDVG
jgi:2-dehydro-3-deoxy-D-arabinonate dehydratase